VAFDPSRLKSQLLNTGLQVKDNPLFQVINLLIDATSKISVDTSGGSSGGGGGGGGGSVIVENNITELANSRIGFAFTVQNNKDQIFKNKSYFPPGNNIPAIDFPLSPSKGGTGTSTVFTLGSVIFAGAGGVYTQDNANFFWDDTNDRLGIGINVPLRTLDVSGSSNSGSGTAYPAIRVKNILATQGNGSTTFNFAEISIQSGNETVDTRLISQYDSALVGLVGTITNHDFGIFTSGSANRRITVTAAGLVGIGITNPSSKLVVSNGGVEGLEIAPGGGNVVFQSFNRFTSAYIPFICDSIDFRVRPSGTLVLYVDATGVGIGAGGALIPTAYLHLKAGTATANHAPLKLTSGTNLTTAEAGSFEYNGTNLFFTRTGTVRENVLVAVDNVAAPGTTLTPTFTSYYGGNTNALGDPNRWLSVNVLGAVYKIPLYN
jgi:hypothetical protein